MSNACSSLPRFDSSPSFGSSLLLPPLGVGASAAAAAAAAATALPPPIPRLRSMGVSNPSVVLACWDVIASRPVQNVRTHSRFEHETKRKQTNHKYYGTGECFLFKIDGERVTVPNDHHSDGEDSGDDDDDGAATATTTKTLVDGEVSTFGWTGMNMYLQYSEAAGIGMGGGGVEGSFGLFIGEDFLSGSTGRWGTVATADFFVCVPLVCI